MLKSGTSSARNVLLHQALILAHDDFIVADVQAGALVRRELCQQRFHSLLLRLCRAPCRNPTRARQPNARRWKRNRAADESAALSRCGSRSGKPLPCGLTRRVNIGHNGAGNCVESILRETDRVVVQTLFAACFAGPRGSSDRTPDRTYLYGVVDHGGLESTRLGRRKNARDLRCSNRSSPLIVSDCFSIGRPWFDD